MRYTRHNWVNVKDLFESHKEVLLTMQLTQADAYIRKISPMRIVDILGLHRSHLLLNAMIFFLTNQEVALSTYRGNRHMFEVMCIYTSYPWRVAWPWLGFLDKFSKNDRAWNELLFREPNCIFKSYLQLLCIETSTSLGSLLRFWGIHRRIQGSLRLLGTP